MIWTWRRWYAALLMLGAFFTSDHAIGGGVDWDRLLAGEVVVETVQHPDGFSGLRASFTVTAARERIWAVLVDYVNFPQLFPDIDKMRVLAQDQYGAQVEFWITAYESYVDIGGVVPAALVRLVATRKARETGERLRHWIEGRPMPE